MKDARPNWLILITLGFLFPASILAGLGLGAFFDYYFQTTPWGIIVGTALGVAAAYMNFIRLVRLVVKDQDKNNG